MLDPRLLAHRLAATLERVTRRSLPRMTARQEGLGMATIMDRGLAARYGAPYVHLAAFAIDVDRVCQATADWAEARPFGWEVFLTERYLLEQFSGQDAAQCAAIEDVVLAILEGRPDAFGAQLAFAVWDAIERGAWPAASRTAFKSWRAQPGELVAALEPLWQDAEPVTRALSQSCKDAAIDPPLAPPTAATLERWLAP